MKRYLIIELKRALGKPDVFLSILGVTLSLFFSLESSGFYNSVIDTFVYSTEMSGMIITYVFCASAYSTSLCEDREHSYIRFLIIRMGSRRYVLSKVILIYSLAILVMEAGVSLFLLVCKIFLPWVGSELYGLDIYLEGCYGQLLSQRLYFPYCLLYTLHLGFLAAPLAICSAYISLFINNKVTVLVLPVVVYQLLIELSEYSSLNIFIFRAYNKVLPYDWQCFLLLSLISIISTTIVSYLIEKKLQKII